MEDSIERRETVLASRGEKAFLNIADGDTAEYEQEAFCPILCEGDVIGAVIMVSGEGKGKMGEVEQKKIQSAAGLLGRQMEQ